MKTAILILFLSMAGAIADDTNIFFGVQMGKPLGAGQNASNLGQVAFIPKVPKKYFKEYFVSATPKTKTIYRIAARGWTSSCINAEDIATVVLDELKKTYGRASKEELRKLDTTVHKMEKDGIRVEMAIIRERKEKDGCYYVLTYIGEKEDILNTKESIKEE